MRGPDSDSSARPRSLRWLWVALAAFFFLLPVSARRMDPVGPGARRLSAVLFNRATSTRLDEAALRVAPLVPVDGLLCVWAGHQAPKPAFWHSVGPRFFAPSPDPGGSTPILRI